MDEFYNSLIQVKTLSSLAILVLLLAAETVVPFFPGFSARGRALHAGRNLALGFVNSTLIAFLFASLWLGASRESELLNFGLLFRSPPPALSRPVCAILILDLWTYLWHRWNHRNRFLWRFHRIHHSDPRMDVTTASRFHLGEMVLSSALRVPVIFLAGLQLHEIALYETFMFSLVQFHHANLALPPRVDRVLRWFIVTPGMHKVHHSRIRLETDSNYSSLLSIWDRVFRSYRERADLDQIQFGLEEFDEERHQTILGLFATPALDSGKMSRNWFALLWILPVLLASWWLRCLALWWVG